jgi:hypothetical protein
VKSVALVGQMAAGKTTVADVLIQRYGFRKISMIGAFRELFAEAYPGLGKGDEITVERDTPDGPEQVTLTGRGLMQAFAPATRGVDNLFWNRVAFNRAGPLLDAGVPHVSDDVRFRSEAALARERGFVVVRVEAPREVRLERYCALYGRYPTPAEEAAPSEREIDLIEPDFIVNGLDDPTTTAAVIARLAGVDAERIEKER